MKRVVAFVCLFAVLLATLLLFSCSEEPAPEITDEGKSFSVTFFDYSGRKLYETTVKEGEAADPPAVPEREGYRFVGWSDDLTNVTEDKRVSAIYALNDAENVFDIAYTIKEDNSVELTVSVAGQVRLAGVQGVLEIPDGVLKAEAEAVGDAAVNLLDDKVYFIFVSATDITQPIHLFTLRFESTQDALEFSLLIGADDVFDQNENTVDFSVIGQTVVLK